MADKISVPIKVVNRIRWGALNHFGRIHEFVSEELKLIDQNYTFADGHRVRRYRVKKNVHWKIPEEVDISAVPAAEAPRRQGKRN